MRGNVSFHVRFTGVAGPSPRGGAPPPTPFPGTAAAPFLAGPESAARTTAESSGGPAFRRLGRRQRFFRWMAADLSRLALRRRAALDPVLTRSALARVGVYGAGL